MEKARLAAERAAARAADEALALDMNQPIPPEAFLWVEEEERMREEEERRREEEERLSVVRFAEAEAAATAAATAQLMKQAMQSLQPQQPFSLPFLLSCQHPDCSSEFEI